MRVLSNKLTYPADRLLYFIENQGITKYKFHKKIGVSNGFLDKAKEIRTDNIRKILDIYPIINPEWLLTGRGEMLRSQSVQPESTYLLRTDGRVENQKIPLYDLEASLGIVKLFQDSKSHEPIDTISIPNLPKCDGAIYVTGDSMYPLLKSGDIIIYKQINDIINDIFYGEMYLVAISIDDDWYTTVKYLHKSENGNEYVRLVSQNKHHEDKDVLIESIKAMALIKASIRINSM